MEGKLFYSFKAPEQDVRFFALDTTYLDQPQLDWLKKELEGAKEAWKIPFFHHPPYSSAGRHGSDPRIRATLEPIFVANKVSVVFTGHDHVYERLKPQQGITYFVTGSGGKLRRGDLPRGSPLTAKGFDTDNVFLVANIEGDRLTFQAISRTGQVVDSGVVERRAVIGPAWGRASALLGAAACWSGGCGPEGPPHSRPPPHVQPGCQERAERDAQPGANPDPHRELASGRPEGGADARTDGDAGGHPAALPALLPSHGLSIPSPRARRILASHLPGRRMRRWRVSGPPPARAGTRRTAMRLAA